ncbi:SpoIVB peptidase S55 domain-containing protein [Nocardioides sp. GCM10027113]|uniref:SpoIVB peptidase S55 domain-containing protein n=1 Tax=unclassified Nocardioides TaxID=2615069 RepID=UPI003619FC4C
MKRMKARAQGRVTVAVALSVAVVGGVSAATVGPASSADPVGDCAVPFPVAEVTKNQTVTGSTVERGTTPEPFNGTVLGVLEDGIAPDIDMIMAELDSPAIQKAGGIWQGMSGSPVYAEDGRLIGAVAYGLSWGPSPIAGITPFEHMDDYLTAPAPGRIKVDPGTARSISRQSDVSREQAGEFRQLRLPFGVSGIHASRLQKAREMRKEHRYIPRQTASMGAAKAAGEGPGPETVVAGGNLAVAHSHGDITMGGVGTATSVCQGEVVGFGHPAAFLGDASMTLHPADALFVQPESLGAPFKVANLGAPVGTITDDRLTGVTGAFGALPASATITHDLTFLVNGRQRTGTTEVSTPEASAAATFYQQLANHDRVLDGSVQGTELLAWQISGTDNGTPFTVGMTDRYASRWDIAFEAPWDVADAAWVLSRVPGVTLDDISMEASVTDDPSTFKVVRVEQKQRGTWTEVNRRNPAFGRAGGTLNLRAVLEATGTEPIMVPVSVEVPDKRARGASLMVYGGGSFWSSGLWSADSVADVQKFTENTVRNDAVAAQVSVYGGRRSTTSKAASEPTEKVVTGRKRIELIVR